MVTGPLLVVALAVASITSAAPIFDLEEDIFCDFFYCDSNEDTEQETSNPTASGIAIHNAVVVNVNGNIATPNKYPCPGGMIINGMTGNVECWVNGNGINDKGMQGNAINGNGQSSNGVNGGQLGNGMPSNGVLGNVASNNEIPVNIMPGNGMLGNGMPGNVMPGNGIPDNGIAGDGMPDNGMPSNGAEQ